ncbi:MAG TPA: TraR/DksA C4-type zinc finger protein [Gaiellaceae bacterium]|nr:TraR/DksA C4-type zinc finger protein [Gaiellaceae bacterium]
MTGGLDLDHFRSVLESERTRLEGARDAVHHEGSLLEESGDLAIGSGDHIADSATDTYLRELDEGLEENADHLLEEVGAALSRIEDGTYGTCVACGKPIPPERLEAIPYAARCIEDERTFQSKA